MFATALHLLQYINSMAIFKEFKQFYSSFKNFSSMNGKTGNEGYHRTHEANTLSTSCFSCLHFYLGNELNYRATLILANTWTVERYKLEQASSRYNSFYIHCHHCHFVCLQTSISHCIHYTFLTPARDRLGTANTLSYFIAWVIYWIRVDFKLTP